MNRLGRAILIRDGEDPAASFRFSSPKTLIAGRWNAMGNVYRLISTPQLEFPYQVVRPDGLPDASLTLFAREQMQSLSASSVPLYLREIIAFVNWSDSDTVVRRYKWRIDGPPTDVRNILREYLTVAAKCKLTSRADGLGIKGKQTTGWFAAGREVARALPLLSDGAFKVYIYLCLNADRTTGRLNIDQSRLAKALQKSRRSIVTYTEELRRQGICRVFSAINQHLAGNIEISDPFWPYEKQLPASPLAGLAEYTQRIRSLMQTHQCVAKTFGPADEKLAADLFGRQVPLVQVERGLLLGCARKYVALLNGQPSGPITSLKYFSIVIDEAAQLQVSADYWQYLRMRTDRLERQWIEKASHPKVNGSHNS
jgi:hypothetical protein